MKKLIVLCSVILLVSLFMASVVGCEELREVDSHEPNTIVFQTGTPLILILLLVLAGLIGLLALAGVIFGFWVCATDFVEGNERLKNFGYLLICLFMLGGVVGLLYIPYGTPYTVRLTVDRSAGTVNLEERYLLKRDETLALTFAEILSIKCVLSRKTWETGSPPYGKVILVIRDGREIEVSSDGQRYNYDLARRISQATYRHLELIKEK